MFKEYSYGVIPCYVSENGDIQTLLIEEKRGKYRGFPKGHLEKGESPFLTATRELEEETGIKNIIIDQKKIFTCHYYYKRNEILISKYVGYFVGYVSSKKVKIDKKEVMDYSWLSLSAVRKQLAFESLKKIFDKAVPYMKKHNILKDLS